MSLETDDEIVAAIQYGFSTPFWAEYLLPQIQERCKMSLRKLATSKSDDDDITRGWFQALEWVMNMPLQKVNEVNAAKEERERESRLANLDDFRAKQGFRSPYAAPAPGELTEESQES